MNNIWTDKEIEFIKNNYKKMTDKTISTLLGNRTASSVKCKRQDLGLFKDKITVKYTFEDVISEFNKTDYILLSKENEYINCGEKTIRYLCPRHLNMGEMTISLYHLKNGEGCRYCGREIVNNAHRKNDTIINNECKLICDKKKFIYKGFDKINNLFYIKYLCPKHLNIGIQYMRKGNMDRDNIVGCPYCFDNKKYKFSKGEKKVENYLTNNNIQHIRQYRFEDCRDINMLPFDFYLPDFNTIIEYDGQHHYSPINFNGITDEEALENHKNTIKHDKIKDNYCYKNKINIHRIPYFEFDNIDSIISDFLFNIKNEKERNYA